MIHRMFLIAGTAAASLSLGGCGGTRNRGLESVHQPVVATQNYAFDLRLGAGGALSPGEAGRLAGWLDAMRVGYGDRVSVDDPAGRAGPARREVSGLLYVRGLLMDAQAPVTAGPVAPGTMRVVVARSHASVPGCPDYSRDPGNEFDSNTSSNYGCSVNANLASMIASPADLLRGRDGDSGFDPRQSGKAINAYRGAALGGGGGQTIKSEKAGSN